MQFNLLGTPGFRETIPDGRQEITSEDVDKIRTLKSLLCQPALLLTKESHSLRALYYQKMLSTKFRSQIRVGSLSRRGISCPLSHITDRSCWRIVHWNSTRNASSLGGPLGGQVGPMNQDDEAIEETPKSSKSEQTSKWTPVLVRMFESAATTFASILVLRYKPLS